MPIARVVIAACVVVLMAVPTPARAGPVPNEAPAVTEIKTGTLAYWSAGEFTRDGEPVDPPQETVQFRRPLAIMTHQVTAAEYRRCVDENVCAATAGGEDDIPVVAVSWRDAETYAEWLSRKTGAHYRLPTDQEWTYAAGSRAPDGRQFRIGGDAVDRWISRFSQELRSESAVRKPQTIGYFGVNENGLLDVAGNVWEWTSSCYTRTVLDESGTTVTPGVVNCGVRVVEGRHRAYVTDFVRDARAGGCAAGIPPTNLGFRLVRDDRWSWRLF